MDEKMMAELKENISTLSAPDFEELTTFVFHQGKERNAGINKFTESLSWRIEPRHEDTVN